MKSSCEGGEERVSENGPSAACRPASTHDDAFQRVLERQRRPQIRKLELEVLAEEGEMQQEEVLRLETTALLLLGAKSDFFSEKCEMRVVTEQAQHYEVSVKSVQAVSDVGVIASLCP